jgi:hypothetical protein
MAREQRRDLALVLLAVSSSVMTNFAVNGLSELLRILVLIFMMIVFSSALWFLSDDLDLPLSIRSKEWTRHKLAELEAEDNERDRRLITGVPPRAERGFQEQRQRDRLLTALRKRRDQPSLSARLRSRLKWKR